MKHSGFEDCGSASSLLRRSPVQLFGRTSNLVPPEFEERGGEIVVRFRPVHYVPPTRVEHNLNDLQREILKIVAKAEEAPLSDILEALGNVPRRTVQDNLQTLCSLDRVDLEGRGRGAR